MGGIRSISGRNCDLFDFLLPKQALYSIASFVFRLLNGVAGELRDELALARTCRYKAASRFGFPYGCRGAVSCLV